MTPVARWVHGCGPMGGKVPKGGRAGLGPGYGPKTLPRRRKPPKPRDLGAGICVATLAASPAPPARPTAEGWGLPNAEDVMAERKKGSSGRGAGRSSGRGGGGRSSSGRSSGSRSQGGSSRSATGRAGASREGRSARSGGTSRGASSPRGSSRSGYKGPSTQPVSEGLEGSVLEGASGYGDTQGQRRSTGTRSEPQHVSGYGRAGGTPKTSSDQPPRNREQPLGGSRKRGSRAQGRLADEEAGDGL